MTCSLIITVHQKAHYIHEFLNKVRRTDNFELIIIDDGSTDGSHYILQKHADIFCRTDDVWETKANNVGLKHATGDHICILQDDDLPTAQLWLTNSVKFMIQHDINILSGRGTCHSYSTSTTTSKNYDKNNIKSEHLETTEEIFFSSSDKTITRFNNYIITKDNLFSPVFLTDVTIRSPFIIDRKSLNILEGFDETYAPLSYDDHDFCTRAGMAGLRIAATRIPQINRFKNGSYWLWSSNSEKANMIKQVYSRNIKLFSEKHSEYFINKKNKVEYIGLIKNGAIL